MSASQIPAPSAQSARRMTDDGKPLIEVRNLVKYYPISSGVLRRKVGDVRAVDGVSFEVGRKEILGLVGESGCGKSTLGRTLLRLQPQTGGEAFIDGEPIFKKQGADLKRLRRRMQIVFQDPVASLNPRMPVSDIIGEGLLAQADRENQWGSRKVRDDRVGKFLEYVGLRRDYARRYPHEFSGGQRQRIGIARALALDPDFIVCDEPVSALDVSIQSQILNLLIDLRREFGLTYLFIAHNLSVVQYISDRVGVMYLGKIMELAPVERLYAEPRHPYTVALLSAVPEADPRRRKKRIVLRGDVPSPANPPSGCRFRTRCWLFEQLGRPQNCIDEEPPLADQGGGQWAACHWTDKITGDAIARAAQTAAPVSSADAGSVIADDDSDAPVIPPPMDGAKTDTQAPR
ncbi:MAG TPA: oligopeptide/dipeptide ABC transporter ATP-binding protein [Candidatus Limnocylindrales bacterium]